VFANTGEGFTRLSAWLRQNRAPAEPAALHACLESTSHYGVSLARFLHRQGHRVSVVNPTTIRAFARCELSRTKTDKADAARIARYCQTHSPRVWEPPTAQITVLNDLVRRLETLQQMRLMEHNRLVGLTDGSADL